MKKIFFILVLILAFVFDLSAQSVTINGKSRKVLTQKAMVLNGSTWSDTIVPKSFELVINKLIPTGQNYSVNGQLAPVYQSSNGKLYAVIKTSVGIVKLPLSARLKSPNESTNTN